LANIIINRQLVKI